MPLPEVTALENTCVLETPSPLINAAFRYAKDSLARSIRWYSLGWGISSAPDRNVVVTAAETAWICPGADYVAPFFTPAALSVFRDKQRSSGAIAESVDMESGALVESAKSVSESAALYVRAVVRRFRYYPSPFYREAFHPSVRRAADHLLAEIGQNGLIVVRPLAAGDAASGEVTRLNALAAEALRLTAEFTGETHYRDAGDALATAIDAELWDEQNGVHALARDPESKAAVRRVSADALYPVLCGATSPERQASILEKLSRPAFQSIRGLRSEAAGDVRADVTLRWAVAVAKSDPRRAVEALERVARPAVIEADAREAVSRVTEFGGEFDGDSGVRKGAAAAPAVAPEFLWAALEGLLGLTWLNGEPRFAPNWPSGWNEITLRTLPTNNGALDVTLRRGEEYRPAGVEDEGGTGDAPLGAE